MEHDRSLLLGQVLSLEPAENHDTVLKTHHAQGRDHYTVSDVVQAADWFRGYGGLDKARRVPHQASALGMVNR
ncbi:MAG: hypothetical protein WAS25_06425 [Geothrix sp.]|uniref:hypothetical protein n=1 Tax=Geothrix sp. TaxID=1962974 RepID=UPI003BB1BF28